MEMTRDFQWAQSVDFPQKTLLLYGATWFPTDVGHWEKVLDNRIFHRKGSRFYVGEKLNRPEILDSLRSAGFQIYEKIKDIPAVSGY